VLPIEEIKKIFHEHGNVMRTADLVAAKIYYADIQMLLEVDLIEKIKRGYYHLVDFENLSEVNIINHLFPEAVLCLDTALFYYGYSDRTSSVWHLAVDKDIQKSRLKIDYPFIKPYFLEPHVLEILDITTGNDYIKMEARGFEKISLQRKYNDISTQIIGSLKNVRVPFNVDIGIGDVIIPDSEQRRVTTQLPNFESPEIHTYSLEITIAEKFDAIMQRFELTGRMKNFFDIYYLAKRFDFDGQKLQKAIFETLKNRGTTFDENILCVLLDLKRTLICK